MWKQLIDYYKTKYPGLELEIESSTKTHGLVNFYIIEVPRAFMGRGVATSVLKDVTKIADDEFLTIPYFNLKIPNSLLKDDLNFYDPRLSFNEMKDWDVNALKLAEKFNNNFQKFKSVGSAMVDKYSSFGPKI